MREEQSELVTSFRQRRDEAFTELVADVQGCRACTRMEGRTRLLSAANGSTEARVCFIAEAPGRFGGERTGVPLSADQSGKNFARLLDAAGLDRASVFITNAVLCNPQDAKGRNAPPTKAEIRTCSGFLASTLQVLQPEFVVTLGSVALAALALIEPHTLKLGSDYGQPVRWSGRWLIPLYHPSPRAQLSRSFPDQLADFQRLGAFIRADSVVLHSNTTAAPGRGEEHHPGS
jgi:DNA polymerase